MLYKVEGSQLQTDNLTYSHSLRKMEAFLPVHLLEFWKQQKNIKTLLRVDTLLQVLV